MMGFIEYVPSNKLPASCLAQLQSINKNSPIVSAEQYVIVAYTTVSSLLLTPLQY